MMYPVLLRDIRLESATVRSREGILSHASPSIFLQAHPFPKKGLSTLLAIHEQPEIHEHCYEGRIDADLHS
jgi:hypothetical protein